MAIKMEMKAPYSSIPQAFAQKSRQPMAGKSPNQPGPGLSLYGKYPKSGARIKKSVKPPPTTRR